MAHWNSANSAFQQNTKSLHETALIVNNDGQPFVTPNHLNNPVFRVDDDTVQHTSRNRRKVSDQSILYFNNVQYDTDNRSFDFSSANAFANVVFSEYDGAAVLQVSNTASANVIRQSRAVIPYFPGRQNELLMSVRFTTPQEGIRRRVGLFDANNGIFFEDDGGTYSCVIRRNTASGTVENRVTRDNWNVDKLDGTGQSLITANAEAVQMFTIEYEHFGAGQVEFNWVIDNNKYPIHQFNTGNIANTFWSTTPFLPIRQELTNKTGVSGDHKFYIGSSAVATEGTAGPLGRESGAASAITGYSLGASANVFKPVLAIRMKSNRLQTVVYPRAFQGATLDNTDIFYRIIEDPTLTGGSWADANDESAVEYNATATSFTGGRIIQTGFVNGGAQGNIFTFPEDAITLLKRKSMGTEGEILLLAIASVGANKSAFGTMSWLELR